MATLVLSAAGAAVGGPVAGAIGGMVGRHLDRALSAVPTRLSDLRMPSSQYGDMIPAIHGYMRVAGVVLWASEPVTTATVSKSGTSQGITVSFAFGVSSAPVERVLRIWADDRLIRDGDGNQASDFELRFYRGTEDQPSDPLIASILGEDRTPAFRGISYLLFEDFDLSEFGNRLPVITVEIDGPDQDLTCEKIVNNYLGLDDAETEGQHDVEGYAVSGDDVASAIAPLREAFNPIFTCKSGTWLLAPSAARHIIDAELWNGKPRQASFENGGDTSLLPTKISLRYFDAALDFAAGEKNVRLPGSERIKRIELPATLSSDSAKATAAEILANVLLNFTKRWIRLPLTFANIDVGDRISSCGQSTDFLLVCAKKIANGELFFQLRNERAKIPTSPTDSGSRPLTASLTQRPLAIAVVEMPGALFDSGPEIAVLVSGGHQPFKKLPISISYTGRSHVVSSANTPSPPGHLLNALPPGRAEYFDLVNSVHVSFGEDPILLSCSETDLLSGANLLSIGTEFLQFGTAEPLGNAEYRLSKLLRGRFDSMPAIAHPSASSVFVLDETRLATVRLPRDLIGSSISARVDGPGNTVDEVQKIITGLASAPWSPTDLTVLEDVNGLRVSWVRRCKEGAPWLDGADAPLGSSQENYLLTLTGQAGGQLAVQAKVAHASIAATELTRLGARPWRVEVQQLGDFAASRPAVLFLD